MGLVLICIVILNNLYISIVNKILSIFGDRSKVVSRFIGFLSYEVIDVSPSKGLVCSFYVFKSFFHESSERNVKWRS